MRRLLLLTLLLALGLHKRPRAPHVNTPHGANGKRPKGGDADVDARRRKGSGTDADPARRSRHATGATVRARQTSLKKVATGSTARPKAPGAPKGPDRLPAGRTRKDAKGKDITLDPDRVKKAPTYTRGFNEDMPAPVYDPKTKKWTVTLRMHEGWDRSDFEAKANHLKNLGDEGKLVKTPDTGDLRSDQTDAWRAAKEREAFAEATDQADLDRRLAELDGQQVDHAQDLQLGGKDGPDNMWGIDSATNHGMGGQLRGQLRQVPDGAQIQINVVHDKYSPKR
ncbi:hypothetical protein [Glycomyces sp. NPDC047010]|uniref:hypothetical protein n=1 Tax=Glycomyces sp. NPDC047010 TaxID=3155023 RepID=UPI003405927E